MTASRTPPLPAGAPERAPFTAVLRAEWIKFRTVRGWVTAPITAALLCLVFTFLVADGTHTESCSGAGTCKAGHAHVPTGPDGRAVADSYYTVGGRLTGDGTVTTRITSLTGVTSTVPAGVAPSQAQRTRPGLAAWAKAGILLRPSTRQGSAYAAVMATGGHGDRFQYDYGNDVAGRRGPAPHRTIDQADWLARASANAFKSAGFSCTLSPQPHSPVWFGFLKVKPDLSTPSSKSITVPSRNSVALGST